MNFHQQNRKGKKFVIRKLFIGFLILTAGVFIINITTNGFLGQIVRVPMKAVWEINNVMNDKLKQGENMVTTKGALLQESILLKERIRKLELYALNNLVLESENNELRKLFDNGNTEESRGILARVISNGGEFPYGTISIASEGSTPLAVGSFVFGAGNVVIGTLSVSSKGMAVVTLVSAPDEENQVLIGIDDRIIKTNIRGVGNGNMIAKIPRDINVRINDPVVLLAKETALVGFVGDITVKPTNAFQLVRVRTPINLETVRFVRVR